MPPPMDIEEIFGESTFGLAEMRARLPKQIYRALIATIEQGSELDPSVADAVALAMKEWALEKGATHFTHWFQPLTGYTAEKHDSFITPNVGRRRGGGVLGQGPHPGRAGRLARSPRAGCARPSRRAATRRGTPPRPPSSWRRPSGSYLSIPTAFAVVDGGGAGPEDAAAALHARARPAGAARAEALRDARTNRVMATLGPEQEFFLIDQEFYYRRPDLVTTGRTLFGAKPPRGQELEDHYFGTIPERVLAFMMDVERELYRLGVPVKTRHNEVAPGQYEMAPIYENANLAADHQQLTMLELRNAAREVRAGLPAAREAVRGGERQREARELVAGHRVDEPASSRATTRTTTMQFLFFCTAVLRAVDAHQDLLRASVAHAGNDHRLGANEAPPAIISIFLGDQLTDVLEQIEKSGSAKASKAGRAAGAGHAGAAAAAAARGRPQPHLALRLHGQQVRVPRGGLLAVDLLPRHGAEHHHGRVARRDVRASWRASWRRGPPSRTRCGACWRARSRRASASSSTATATARSGRRRPGSAACSTCATPSTRSST